MNDERSSYAWYFYALMFGVACAVLILRRPDIVTNAQPWAEDGAFWFRGVYERGLSSLLLPESGYYQTLSRSIWAVAMQFGLRRMALAATLIAVAMRAAFATFLLSSRLKKFDLHYRLCAYFYLLLMPNLTEGYVSANTVHWHMCMYLLATLLADEPKTPLWKAHDYALLFFGGLSGPFVLFMAPCLLLKRVSERGSLVKAVKGANAYDLAFALATGCQLVAVVFTADAIRSHAPLGATPTLIADIVSSRVIVGSFVPNEFFLRGQLHGAAFSWLGVVLLLVLLVYFFATTKSRTGAIILLFAVLVPAFGLMRPMISPTEPQLPLIITQRTAERYFFIPYFAFGLLAFFFVEKIGGWWNKTVRDAVVILIFVLLGANCRIPQLPDVGYKQAIERFDKAERGDTVMIPLAPPGWYMELMKK